MNILGWPIFIIGVLAIIFVLLVVVLPWWAKGQFKKDAYRLLRKSNPSSREIEETIKGLNTYVGRWSKDKEIKELIKRLMNKLEEG